MILKLGIFFIAIGLVKLIVWAVRRWAETRDYKKESTWEKNTYKIFRFKARKDNGEVERLEKSMGDKSFADWVRTKLNEEK